MKRSFNILLVAEAAVFLALACGPGKPLSVGDLPPNEEAFVEWIPLDRAATERITGIDAPGTAHFADVHQRVVDIAVGGGEIMDVQVQLAGATLSGILRGHVEEFGLVLHMLNDQSPRTEWSQIPSIMAGPHLVLPMESVDKIVAEIQEWLAAHGSPDVRVSEVQIDVRQGRSSFHIRGSFRWAPSSRHLHSVVVSCLNECR